MIHLIATKHLVLDPVYESVYDRATSKLVDVCKSGNCMILGQLLGHSLRRGPDVFISDLDVIQEWQWLQEFSSTARK